MGPVAARDPSLLRLGGLQRPSLRWRALGDVAETSDTEVSFRSIVESNSRCVAEIADMTGRSFDLLTRHENLKVNKISVVQELVGEG